MGLSKEQIEERLAGIQMWRHSINLGEGIVTSGGKSASLLAQELAAVRFPSLAGKSVLDIGAWDGFFSFEAEKRGAARVVALDHYVWSVDWAAAHRYLAECSAKSQKPKPWETLPDVWKPEALPGKGGFDLASEALGSKVEPLIADFMSTDLDKLGAFDVVLYLGVLYHMEEPLRAMRRVASVTREMAVIETEAVALPGYENHAFCEFFEADELGNDPSNWWAPNEKALIGLCKAAGFRKVEVLQGPPKRARSKSLVSRLRRPKVLRYRAILHAWK